VSYTCILNYNRVIEELEMREGGRERERERGRERAEL